MAPSVADQVVDPAEDLRDRLHPPLAIHSSRRRARWRTTHVTSFAVVGGAGLIVDLSTFNLLTRIGPKPLEQMPLTARIVAVGVACLVTYLGNRFITWRERTRTAMLHELAVFAVLNLVGMVVTTACLATSHYVLGLRSSAADNLSSFAIGVPLGTWFRYWAYQRFIFKPSEPSDAAVSDRHAAGGGAGEHRHGDSDLQRG